MKKYLTLGLLVSGLVLGGCSNDNEKYEDENVEKIVLLNKEGLGIKDDSDNKEENEQHESEELKDEKGTKNNDEYVNESEEDEVKEEGIEKENELKKEQDVKNKKEKNKIEIEDVEKNNKIDDIANVLEILSDNYSDFAKVSFDDENKVFTIIPTDPNFSLEVYLASQGDEECLVFWKSFIESQKKLSVVVSDLLGNEYGVSVLNPSNTENSILLCMDGVIFYDGIAGVGEAR